MHQSAITAEPNPLAAKRTAELLADLVAIHEELQDRDLSTAPTDLLNSLEDGEGAAIKLLEWLGERARPSRDDWSGASSFPGVL